MTTPTNLDTKFFIRNIDEHNQCLKIHNGSYAIGTRSKKGVEDFEELIKGKLGKKKSDDFLSFTNSNGKSINNNSLRKKPFQSLRNVHTVMCWLFSESIKPLHTIEHVKLYLNNLEIQKDKKEPGAIRTFRDFINTIYPFLSEEFKKYNYRINPKTWQFEVTTNETIAKNDGSNNKNLPKKITFLPTRNPSDVIGRSSDITKIHDLLKNEKRSIVIRAMAGIGKTTIAMAYAFEYYDYYDHIVWLDINKRNLKNVIYENEQITSTLNIDIKQKNPDIIVSEVLFQLNQIEAGHKLIILDNVNSNIENYLVEQLPKQPNWHLLATSQHPIEGLFEVKIDFLKIDYCVQLFKRHCIHINSQKEIESIVQKVGYHTLTIEILAKTCQYQRLNYNQIIETISNDRLSNIKTSHSRLKPIKQIYRYLESIFDIINFNKYERWIIRQFLCLPDRAFDYDFIYNLLAVENWGIVDTFNINLKVLVNRGLILYIENDDTYRMHPIVREVLKKKINQDSLSVISLVKTVQASVCIYPELNDPFSYRFWMPFAYAIDDIFNRNITGHIIAGFYFTYGTTLLKRREIKDALDIFQKLVTFYEPIDVLAYEFIEESEDDNTNNFFNQILGIKSTNESCESRFLTGKIDEHIQKIMSIHSLADCKFMSDGNYEQKLKSYKEIRIMYEDLFNNNKLELRSYIGNSYFHILKFIGNYEEAISYIDFIILKSHEEEISDLYRLKLVAIQKQKAKLLKDIFKYEDALKTINEVIAIEEELIGKQNFIIIESYKFKAKICYKLEKYEEAKFLMNNVIEFKTNFYHENHFQQNKDKEFLGIILLELKEYKKAMEIFRDSLEFKMGFFEDKNDPEIATTHYYISLTSPMLGNIKNAKKHIIKAKKIFDNLNIKYHKDYDQIFRFYSIIMDN